MPVISWNHAGPDDPIYKSGLKVNSVPASSALTKRSPTDTDGAKSASAAAGEVKLADSQPAK